MIFGQQSTCSANTHLQLQQAQQLKVLVVTAAEGNQLAFGWVSADTEAAWQPGHAVIQWCPGYVLTNRQPLLFRGLLTNLHTAYNQSPKSPVASIVQPQASITERCSRRPASFNCLPFFIVTGASPRVLRIATGTSSKVLRRKDYPSSS